MASISPPRKATVAGVCSSWDSVIALDVDVVGLEQFFHQARHAAAGGADVQAQALQLRQRA